MRYLVRRLLALPAVLLAAVTLVFVFIHAIPGDPIEVALGETARPADKEALRKHWGLDRPVAEQYVLYVRGLFRGDLGYSYSSRRPVSELVRKSLPKTLYLAAVAMVIALAIALPLGVLAALRANGPVDRLSTGLALLGVSIPNFWLGILLIQLFAVRLDWLPVSGFSGLTSVLLPAFTLGASLAGILTRMTRSSLLDTLGQDYVRVARAKGLPESSVVLRHALRNSLIPVVTLSGLQFGALLAGAVVTEKVFAWPGIGTLLIHSGVARDYPLLQGCILMIAATYVVVNLATDLLYGWIHPQVRLEEPT